MKASGVLCSKNVTPKIKGKFYRVVIRPTMLYEVDVNQSRTFISKNESCINKNVEIDM